MLAQRINDDLCAAVPKMVTPLKHNDDYMKLTIKVLCSSVQSYTKNIFFIVLN